MGGWFANFFVVCTAFKRLHKIGNYAIKSDHVFLLNNCTPLIFFDCFHVDGREVGGGEGVTRLANQPKMIKF